MVILTENEQKALLILLKEYSSYYNANSLSKMLGISREGTQKILKRLLAENLLISKNIGKSIVYKISFNDDYVKKLLAYLLADEANHYKRWKLEFRDLFKGNRIILVFGSAIRDYEKARDIDIMIVMEQAELKEINKILAERQAILPKRLHSIKLTREDLLKNLNKKDKIMLDIIKNAVVLYGQNDYLEVMQNVTVI
jgi:predicted nucleotidyltransferase